MSVGQDESHLAVLLCYHGQRAQVIYINVGRAQEVVGCAEQHFAVVILYAEPAVLLEHLVILFVLFAYAVEVEHHLALVVHQLQQIAERVAVVGHGAGEHYLEVESAQHLAVQVYIACYRLLLLSHAECGELLLELEHDALAALHRLYVAVYLACHLVAHELVDACHFDAVHVCIFEIFLCYHFVHSVLGFKDRFYCQVQTMSARQFFRVVKSTVFS